MANAGHHAIRVTYWAITYHPDEELLAVFKSKPGENLAAQTHFVDDQLGHNRWRWKTITQAEFETYLAFDIKRIEL